MTLKMIVLDMDGTLLSSEEKILPKTKQKLIDLQKKGITVVLASGRSYLRMIEYAKDLLLDKFHGYLIDVNGSSIYDMKSDQRERIGILDKNDIHEITHFFSNYNVELQYNLDDTVYTYLNDDLYDLKFKIRSEMKLPKDYPWKSGMFSWLSDTRDGYPHQILIRDIKDTPNYCNKMTISQEPDYTKYITKVIEQSKLKEHYEFVATDYRNLEVTRKGINKGNTLNLLMDRLDVRDDEAIIFGDSENDVSMFKNKKFSVAMGNSLPITKELAQYETDSNDEEGIYHFLNKCNL